MVFQLCLKMNNDNPLKIICWNSFNLEFPVFEQYIQKSRLSIEHSLGPQTVEKNVLFSTLEWACDGILFQADNTLSIFCQKVGNLVDGVLSQTLPHLLFSVLTIPTYKFQSLSWNISLTSPCSVLRPNLLSNRPSIIRLSPTPFFISPFCVRK